MPAIGESKDAQGNLVLPPADMWALVHYVRSLSEREEIAQSESGDDGRSLRGEDAHDSKPHGAPAHGARESAPGTNGKGE